MTILPISDLSADGFTAVVDALHRFAAGQDLRDRELFASAWTDDAELDFTQPAARLGVELPPFRGREAIVPSILAALEPLVTTHTVTNPRVRIAGDDADLHALVEAQHVLAKDPSRFLLLKNHYHCALRRFEGIWRIRHMRIATAWLQGDPRVLFPVQERQAAVS